MIKLTRKEAAVQAVIKEHAKVKPGQRFGSVASISEAAGGTGTFTTVDAVRVAREERGIKITTLMGPRWGGYYKGVLADVLQSLPDVAHLVIHDGVAPVVRTTKKKDESAADDTTVQPADHDSSALDGDVIQQVGDDVTLQVGDLATIYVDGTKLIVTLHAPLDVVVQQAV